MAVGQKKNEWIELPLRSLQNADYEGSPIRVIRSGDRVGLIPPNDIDVRAMTFQISELREALDGFEGLPMEPEGPIG